MRVPATATEREAAEVIYGVLSSGAQEVGATFTEPDDDWEPVWMVNDGKGHGTVLAPDRMEGASGKTAMTHAVAYFARKVGAVAIGHLTSSWIVEHKDVSAERMREVREQMDANDGSTEGIPERREVLLVAVYTAGGFKHRLASIERHDGPPTLGPWEVFADSEREGLSIDGRMATPLQESLRRLG